MFDQFELIHMDQRSNKDALRHNTPSQDDECESKACRRSLTQESHLKAMSKLAQRAQRECTGYYCGYTFKRQPVGQRFLKAAAESYSYMTVGLQDKAAGQQWHRITHRVLTDFQHRSMLRPAAEEWNLAANWHEQDPTNAEFLRTYRSVDFPGWRLVNRLAAETRQVKTRETRKRLRHDTDSKPLQNFEDLYGFRGQDPAVFLLSPWEFLRLWECVPYNEFGTVPIEEQGRYLIFPLLEGDMQLREHWYMRRRIRPMVPAPSSTPMPDKQADADEKAKLYSLYLRPWVLDKRWATREVPFIADLDVLQQAAPPRTRVRQKTSPTVVTRSFSEAWRWYIRGHVVSQHAVRMIVQFMAACCGKSTSGRDLENEVREADHLKELPANDLSLTRVHDILHRMSQAGPGPAIRQGRAPPKTEENDSEQLWMDNKALQQSEQIRDAMRSTAALWTKVDGDWSGSRLDTRQTSVDQVPSGRHFKKIPPKKNKLNPKAAQKRAYVKWHEVRIKEWWSSLRSQELGPTAEQHAFLERVVGRCRVERAELMRVGEERAFTEPVRDCLFGLPGAGKSTCIKWIRSFFEQALGWEHGVQFQFLAAQNTMAALIGGNTVHSWGSIPVNASAAGQKTIGKDSGDVDALFLNALGIRWILFDETSCISAELLGLLDVYLRRACARHPYARREERRSHRPFGGFNVVFAGDLWQLPPVRATAIFSNPCAAGYPFEVQRIFKMFWQTGEDAVQQTFVLTKSMRTGDPWLRAVLDADRNGCETWEMYCFTHGLPTRNAGSWLPDIDAPTCGVAHCGKLAKEIWPTMRGLSWYRRNAEECAVCVQERRRRHCILITGQDAAMATSMHTVAEVSEVAQPQKRRIIMPHAPFAKRLKTTGTEDTDGADLKPALSAESDLAGVTGSLRTTDANGLESSSAITDTTGTDMKDAVAATGYAVMATGLEETEGADGGGRGSVDMRRR